MTLKKLKAHLKIHMPVWSRSEMEAIAPLSERAREWEATLKILGGIPRGVFQNATSESDAREQIEGAINDLDDRFLFIIHSIDNAYFIAENAKIVHRAIHVTSKRTLINLQSSQAFREAQTLITCTRTALCNR